ncbi:MAG: hypothetical protein U9P72_02290 [Campylobacterota bacterium]|nr:hypothetical protein [Campylobacterota bacterium]
MIYAIYIVLIIISIILYHINTIYQKLKPFYFKGKNAIKNPRVTRDVSLAMMVNSLFSLLNASFVFDVLGYLILTFIGAVGIIVSNDKIQD